MAGGSKVDGPWSSWMGSTRQHVLLETLAARQRAAELLKVLQQAQAECEKCLQQDKRQDAMRAVTGSSSIEQAIASTKRMIETLDRALDEARNGMTDDELASVTPVVLAKDALRPMGDRSEVVARIGPAGVATWSAAR